jgi:multidrug transporter EmrE-like cation transporter
MMASSTVGYVYIAFTVAFTVYGQLVLKWQIAGVGAMPAGGIEKLVFLLQLLFNPWVFSAFVAAFLASLAWMAAMTKFDISHAYPFMSLNFVLVVLAGGVLFHEAITPYKLGGLMLIVAGIVVGSRG